MSIYRVGDVVTYHTFGGTPRTVTVTKIHDDVKDGQPGFSGDNADGKWWGYDDQIVSVQTPR